MRILLVEDDPMIGAAVEQALKDAAYAVDWVTDGATERQGSGASPILSNGVIELNPATFEVSASGNTSRLTAREFALLRALLTHPGTILSRADLERHIYGWNEEVESNAVEFLIHAIRKKIGAAAIRNVRGVGWMVDRSS
jgi:two-component system OmpR family response regulator